MKMAHGWLPSLLGPMANPGGSSWGVYSLTNDAKVVVSGRQGTVERGPFAAKVIVTFWRTGPCFSKIVRHDWRC